MNIQQALIKGDMQAWAITPGSSDQIYVVGTTAIVNEIGTGNRNLLIYTVNSYAPPTREQWIEAVAAIKEFARVKGCNRVIAYSNVPSIIELVKRVGGETSFHYLTMEV